MANQELCQLTLSEAAAKIEAHTLSPVELTDAVLQRIEALNPQVNAFVTVCGDDALAAARTAEAEIARGEYRGPLHGVPVGVKDLFDTAGVRTTYGSGMFREYVPARDAAVVARLKAAGAVIVGKTNAHEFGLGVTTNNYFYGATRNPWNLDHVPGGSSGGSAAAIAASLCPVTIGSDGGGSIRLPCVFCGVVGVKPSRGRISGSGEFGIPGTSFAVPGPITGTVEDAALVLTVIAGFDPEDPWTVPLPVPDFRAALEGTIRGVRVGVSPDFLVPVPHPDVRAGYEQAVARLAGLGAEIIEVRVRLHDRVVPTLFTVMGGEASAFLGAPEQRAQLDLSPEMRQLLDEFPVPSVMEYVHGARERQAIRQEYLEIFRTVDVLALPSAPIPAPRIGEEVVAVDGTEHRLDVFCCAYTAAANLTGLPAVPVPAGLSREGLPVGIQIVAPEFEEARALRVAHHLLADRPEVRRPL